MREQRPVLQKYLEDTDSVGFFAKDADRATASIIFTLDKGHVRRVAAHSRWRLFNSALDER